MQFMWEKIWTTFCDVLLIFCDDLFFLEQKSTTMIAGESVERRETSELLVGMWIGAATTENSMEAP